MTNILMYCASDGISLVYMKPRPKVMMGEVMNAGELTIAKFLSLHQPPPLSHARTVVKQEKSIISPKIW